MSRGTLEGIILTFYFIDIYVVKCMKLIVNCKRALIDCYRHILIKCRSEYLIIFCYSNLSYNLVLYAAFSQLLFLSTCTNSPRTFIVDEKSSLFIFKLWLVLHLYLSKDYKHFCKLFFVYLSYILSCWQNVGFVFIIAKMP